MREATLPSPDIGAVGFHLRRVAAKAISAIQIVGPKYPDGKHPKAGALRAFFLACAASLETFDADFVPA